MLFLPTGPASGVLKLDGVESILSEVDGGIIIRWPDANPILVSLESSRIAPGVVRLDILKNGVEVAWVGDDE